jgi:hypothetical protein
MTERAPVAASEHGRHPPALNGEVVMPDRVDATLDRVQPSDRYPVLDLVLRHPESEQLRTGDDPVLAGRALGDQPIDVCYVRSDYSSSRHARRIRSPWV